jgi:hypothetical protein
LRHRSTPESKVGIGQDVIERERTASRFRAGDEVVLVPKVEKFTADLETHHTVQERKWNIFYDAEICVTEPRRPEVRGAGSLAITMLPANPAERTCPPPPLQQVVLEFETCEQLDAWIEQLFTARHSDEVGDSKKSRRWLADVSEYMDEGGEADVPEIIQRQTVWGLDSENSVSADLVNRVLGGS